MKRIMQVIAILIASGALVQTVARAFEGTKEVRDVKEIRDVRDVRDNGKDFGKEIRDAAKDIRGGSPQGKSEPGI